jgi:hypothetical protein
VVVVVVVVAVVAVVAVARTIPGGTATTVQALQVLRPVKRHESPPMQDLASSSTPGGTHTQRRQAPELRRRYVVQLVVQRIMPFIMNLALLAIVLDIAATRMAINHPLVHYDFQNKPQSTRSEPVTPPPPETAAVPLLLLLLLQQLLQALLVENELVIDFSYDYQR